MSFIEEVNAIYEKLEALLAIDASIESITYSDEEVSAMVEVKENLAAILAVPAKELIVSEKHTEVLEAAVAVANILSSINSSELNINAKHEEVVTKHGDVVVLAGEVEVKNAEIKNLSVLVLSLAMGESPTIDYNASTGRLTIGIPRGDEGAKGDKGDSFEIDVYGLAADLSVYDNANANTSYLAVDTSTIYFKISDTAGDWSAGVSFGKGDKGDAGDSLTIESIADNGNGTFTWNFSDATSYTTPDLTGLKGDKGDKGDTGDVMLITASETWTVGTVANGGVQGDYDTLNDAFLAASKVIVAEGVNCYINILSGHEINYTASLINTDLSSWEIMSDDAEVVMSVTGEIGLSITNSILGKINVLFNCAGAEGIYLKKSRVLSFGVNKGCKNSSNTNLYLDVSRIDYAWTPDFSGASSTGIDANDNSCVNMTGANVSNCGYTGLFLRANSIYTGLNLNATECGSYGVYVSSLSNAYIKQASFRKTLGADSSSDLNVREGGVAYIYGSSGGFNLAVNTLTADGYILK